MKFNVPSQATGNLSQNINIRVLGYDFC